MAKDPKGTFTEGFGDLIKNTDAYLSERIDAKIAQERAKISGDSAAEKEATRRLDNAPVIHRHLERKRKVGSPTENPERVYEAATNTKTDLAGYVEDGFAEKLLMDRITDPAKSRTI